METCLSASSSASLPASRLVFCPACPFAPVLAGTVVAGATGTIGPDTGRTCGRWCLRPPSPEYACEHELDRVKAAADELEINYPIAVDSDVEPWTNFQNQYWPALYLFDAHGDVRHGAFGEGRYDETEALTRDLRLDAHPDTELPERTDVPDKTGFAWG